MSGTYLEARDDIIAVFREAWNAAGEDVDLVIYDDLEGSVPDTDVPWARVTLKHDDGGQGSLGDDTGKKIWDRSGTLFVQIFTVVADGLETSYPLAKILDDAYAGTVTPNVCVWFKNGTIREIGPDSSFYQLNFSIDFEYTEVK